MGGESHGRQEGSRLAPRGTVNMKVIHYTDGTYDSACQARLEDASSNGAAQSCGFGTGTPNQ